MAPFGYENSKQGKCEHCRVRYTWNNKPLLRDALCPQCKRPLARTSHEMKRFRHVVATPLWLVAGQ